MTGRAAKGGKAVTIAITGRALLNLLRTPPRRKTQPQMPPTRRSRKHPPPTISRTALISAQIVHQIAHRIGARIVATARVPKAGRDERRQTTVPEKAMRTGRAGTTTVMAAAKNGGRRR